MARGNRRNGRTGGRQLDLIDTRILALVQSNNRLPTEQIGELVGLSATAVQRRLRDFREDGIITDDVSIIDPAATGRPIMMYLLVSLERERRELVERFKDRIRKMPEVMNAHFITGSADFILQVTARDMADYQNFTEQILYDSTLVRKIETLVVIERVKSGMSIPIELGDDE